MSRTKAKPSGSRRARRGSSRGTGRARARGRARPKRTSRAARETTPRITPFLTFDGRAEEAIKLYTSTFPNSRILSLMRSPGGGMIPEGQVLHATFELDGQRFMAMDGGPTSSFAQGFSLFVDCETQEEIDRLWDTLSAGGEKQPCGWLKDRFGVSWQIIPTALGEMMTDPESGNPAKVMEPLLTMSKIDIKALERT